MRWCQSRPLRARRDASRQYTAPTCPSHTAATSLWKPGRAIRPEPERPRSSSMVITAAKPAALARSARAYCRRLPPLALQVAHDLRQGGLANVDEGGAGEVIRGDLRAHR